MKSKRSADVKPIVGASVFILAFAIILFCAMASLGAAEGGIKKAPGAPDSLASAGAPRSQLELKRMFEAMSLSYTEDGLSVIEPISREYRSALEDRIAAGESPSLSVEEILFIISDSSAIYENYDIIRFRSASGEIETEILPVAAAQTGEKPLHVSALERIMVVAELIELRVRLMSADGCFEQTELGEIRYTPGQVEREKGESADPSARAFLFGPHSHVESYSEAVVFLPGNGSRVTLYPTQDEVSLCRTKVVLHTAIEASETEHALLGSVFSEPDRSRNITPEYFYGLTPIRLFALGGRVAIIDGDTGEAILLSDELRLSSMAITVTEQGNARLYFTASDGNGSSLWSYGSGDTAPVKIFESGDKYLAVAETLMGDYSKVSVYRAAKREDESAVTAVECVGEPIAEYFAE